jgi:hypothetical protein
MNQMIYEAGEQSAYCWGIIPAPDNLTTLACTNCEHTMELARTISKIGVLPELLVFHCRNCSASTVLTAMTSLGQIGTKEAHKHAVLKFTLDTGELGLSNP